MRYYFYIILVFIFSCGRQINPEEKTKDLDSTKIFHVWSDIDSTVIDLNDYSNLIESLTSDDTSLNEFKKVFASVKSKPDYYDELAAIMDLHWLYILNSESDKSFSSKKEENIHIKKSNLFKNLQNSNIAFKCITLTAPIDAWYIFKSDGQMSVYSNGLAKYKWEIKKDTLQIKLDSHTMEYVDNDSIFEPIQPGHQLIVIYRK